MTTNRQWLLHRRPDGEPVATDFAYREVALPTLLAPGEVMLKTVLMHLAPTMRNWMYEHSEADLQNPMYLQMSLGEPVLCPVISRVAASSDPTYPVGSHWFHFGGWQDWSIVNPSANPTSMALLPEGIDLRRAMGVLGANGLAAYFGMEKIGRPKQGEVVVVSSAAGSTGSIAAQIAKIHGCKVIGIAGGRTKCDWLRDVVRLDGVVDYKAEPVRERIAELAPEGVDVFFDNVGGETLAALIENMAPHGRIALCGQISTYNGDGRSAVSMNMMRMVYWQIRMEGFLMTQWWDEIDAGRAVLAQWLAEGRIVHREDVRRGFRGIPDTFVELFQGTNEGALMVELA